MPKRTDINKILIIGSGPIIIGQGIEFDYCCVHASFALKEMGIESIMVNSNPETVSTDYDTSDKSQLAVGQKLPLSGTVFISVKDKDKKASQGIAAMLYDAGFKIVATGGTSAFLLNHGIP